MNELCKNIKHIKPEFIKEENVPFDTSSYSCPDEVKQSFSKLKKSTKYSWGNNTVCFFYASGNCHVKCCHIASLLALIQPPNCPLRADIILSPVNKKYPTNKVFGPPHVNTGYASNEKIVIYRKEEWFKVFIHECFHFFHFDRVLFNPNYSDRILQIFPINSEVNVFESYCELSARKINCYMIASYTSTPVEILLRNEKKHSMRHMVNVLAHMGLTYDKIQIENSGFKEETNVLAYVVLANILFNNDYPITSFHLTNGDAYIEFIEKHYLHPEFIQHVQHTTPQITTTMSLHSIDTF